MGERPVRSAPAYRSLWDPTMRALRHYRYAIGASRGPCRGPGDRPAYDALRQAVSQLTELDVTALGLAPSPLATSPGVTTEA